MPSSNDQGREEPLAEAFQADVEPVSLPENESQSTGFSATGAAVAAAEELIQHLLAPRLELAEIGGGA